MKDIRKYRACVRVIIVKSQRGQDFILLGTKFTKEGKKFHEFPGGGLEEGLDIVENIRKECLEEVGIKVKDIQPLQYSYQYEVNYHDPERAKKYRGGIDHWYVAEYNGEDKRLLNIEGDAMAFEWVVPDEAFAKLVETGNDQYNIAKRVAVECVKEYLKDPRKYLSKASSKKSMLKDW